MNELNKFLGGLDNIEDDENIITIYGGDTSNDDKTVLCNWKVIYNIRDKILDWENFLKIYWKNNNIEEKYKNKFYNQVKNILGMKKQISNDNIILLINEIFKTKESILIKKLKKDFNSYECLSLALSELFIVFKKYFEKIIRKYSKERNIYIDNNDTNDKKNNLELLKKKWDKIDSKKNIMTSSILLYFLVPPKNIKTKKLYIDITTQNNELSDNIDKLKKKIKIFAYSGYCPNFPLTRLMKLLMFPLEEFENIIMLLDKKYKKTNFNQAFKILNNHQKKLMVHINKINKMYSITKKKNNSKFNNDIDINKDKYNIKKIKNKIDQILILYTKLFNNIKMIENFYDYLAEVISKITKILRDDIFIKKK